MLWPYCSKIFSFKKVAVVLILRQFLSYIFCAFLAALFSTAALSAPLWLEAKGEGSPTIIFISGNGNDASVWKGIEPHLRKVGVQTVVYDRAGLGNSPLWEGAYTIEGEAEDLQAALTAHGVSGPVMLVAHSYGGYIASLLAENMVQVTGLVFVDAGIPADMSQQLVDYVLAEYTPRFEALEKAATELAKAIIPVVKAYPTTAKRMRTVGIPEHLPVIDILAETLWVQDERIVSQMRKAHANFVATSPNRSSLFAKGSGHNVMKDKPRYVIEAITRILEQLR
ncbi:MULTISPECIES: alpha/beta hydrolase [unclassified Pseudovibrio]|uniref:alpha/beta fold hydrolase n=1 Tax=unclassified Pseudovibrio TaxID=2627060 RepID=UPI0007B1FA0F|nr:MULTISPECIES: alpha/beta hydrolase [unclassified Pseudovibrio]KZL03688.1 Haloalkane dehalogenase [Pseudovibrio sp. W74]KZL09598.1 Haloalkane dehalogenase [Pseudovibrio sp. Ad14]